VETARQKQSVEAELILAEALEAGLEVMYLQEFIVLQDELVKLAVQGAEVQRNNPTIPPKEVLFTRANVAEVKLQRLTTATDLNTARLRLSKALGYATPQMIRVDGRLNVEPLPRVPLDKVIATVRQVRPEIAEARASVEENSRKLDAEWLNARPDVEFGPRFQNRLADLTDRAGLRFGMDLPLFDFNQGAIAESSAAVRVAQAMLSVAEMNSVNDVASAYAELAPLAVELDYYDTEVAPLAQETEKAIREAFEIGAIDSHKMVNEMERLGKIRLQYLQTRYRYNRIRGRLELLLGQSLSKLVDEEERSPFVDDPPPAGTSQD
jgi:outer membrane protein TolC